MVMETLMLSKDVIQSIYDADNQEDYMKVLTYYSNFGDVEELNGRKQNFNA